jgi:phosphocarrier protein HPr
MTGAPETEQADEAFEIMNERGLHARAATKLVLLAGKYKCDVTLIGEDGVGVNAKSVMGVLLLCGAKGSVVRVKAEGPGAAACVTAIGELIRDRFGEAE